MARGASKATRSPPFSSDGEELADFFTPLAILPEQLFSSPPEADRGRGERALMRAILEDAVFCFQTYCHATRYPERRLAQEAEEWFRAEDHRWPFSFFNICKTLSLDPDYIRMGLERWRQRVLRLTTLRTKKAHNIANILTEIRLTTARAVIESIKRSG
jgi:hypothetical protein